jgi:hypothetical protein
MAFKYKTKKRPSPMQLAVTSFAAGAAQGVAGASEQALKRETANKTSRDKAAQKWMSIGKSMYGEAKQEAYRVSVALTYNKMSEDDAFEIMAQYMSDESSFVKLEEPKFLSDEKKLMINQIKFYSEETTDPNRKADLIDLHGKLLGDIITPDEAKEILTTSGLIAGEVTTPAGVVTEGEGVEEIAVPATTVPGAFEPEAEEPEEEPEMEALVYRNDTTGDEVIEYFPKGTEPPETLEDKPGYTRYRKLGTIGLGDQGRVRAWFAQYNRLNEDVFPSDEPYKYWDSTKKENLAFYSRKLEDAGQLALGTTVALREQMGLPPEVIFEWTDEE